MKITPLNLLLVTTFLSTSAVAQTVPTIDANYLNSLTGPKITWTEGEYGLEAIYNKPDDYEYSSSNDLTEENTTNKVITVSEGGWLGSSVIVNQSVYEKTIKADFLNSYNYTHISCDYNGGGINNGGYVCNPGMGYYPSESSDAVLGDIIGSFLGNGVDGSGGAIYNAGTIGNITGDFISNSAGGETGAAYGGAIYNKGTIGNIVGNFIDNTVWDYSNYGGAIYNTGTISSITGVFISNYLSNWNAAIGGAIYNTGTISLLNSDFYYNAVIDESNSATILGGAIYTTKGITLTSDSGAHFFSGNYTQDNKGKIYNAIYVDNSDAVLTFNTSNDSAWVINDNIEGGNYDFIGDDTVDIELGTTTQYINMNNAIVNAKNVNVKNTTLRFGAYQHEDTTANNGNGKGTFISALGADGFEDTNVAPITSLTLNNAVFDIANGYLETIKLKNFASTDNTSNFLHIDVNVEEMKADILRVYGDVYGVTNLVVHASSDADIKNKGQILFAESFGDTKGKDGSFVVSRVYKSPYLYKVIYTGEVAVDVEENSVVITPSEATEIARNNKWYFEITGDENTNEEDAPVDPNPEVPVIPVPDTPAQSLGPIKVAPEVVATVAVKTAGLSQTNGMVYNIMRKVGVNRLFCPGCGFYDYNWDGEAFHNAWVDTTYNGLTIEAPVEIDANVWGIEAGSDIQHDLNNKLGIFVSYRQGNYEMDGKGEKYYSTIGSEIDIDSYLAGLYYRYDRNNWYAFATLYGGMQNAEIKTDDGVSADTDGIEFGGSVEGGYNYALTRTLSVTPSLGVFYSQISYDDATDNVGKTVEYNDLKQVELEAGAKFAYTQYTDNGFYSLYVKPSVVQTLVDGDEIEVTELGKVDTVEDKTLGRVEIGGNYGFNDNWSAYGWANYTFGSDYEATSLGAGLNYAW